MTDGQIQNCAIPFQVSSLADDIEVLNLQHQDKVANKHTLPCSADVSKQQQKFTAKKDLTQDVMAHAFAAKDEIIHHLDNPNSWLQQQKAPSAVHVQQHGDTRNAPSFTQDGIAKTIVINGDHAVINCIPTINMSLVGPTHNNINVTKESKTPSPPPQKSIPDRDLQMVVTLSKSQRVLTEEDIDLVSKNMGNNWEEVGYRLMFNKSQLEQFHMDTTSHVKATYRMLYRWVQWKDERATVRKLTKALFMADEYDAIRVLEE